MQLVKLDDLGITSFASMDEAVQYIVAGGEVRKEFAIAINAEKIVSAINEPKIMEVLQAGTLRYADGIPIVWALKQKGVTGVRIAGCDLWTNLMEKSVFYKTPVYIVGASAAVNISVAQKLREVGVNLVGTQDGYFRDESEVIEKIVHSKPKIVTVAMGSPAQEIFIQKCRGEYPEAFYMGVGGTYDVYVGKVKRAPLWMQKFHLEWSYRLLKQPSRIFRQANLFKYIWLLLTKKL